MMGERVAVLTRADGGIDEMGDPIAVWSAETVEGALVRPLSGEDLKDARRPDGVRAEYSIAFPKSYTGEVRGARIALVDRGMDASDAAAALVVSGAPDRTRPCPTLWNMVAEAGRADG